MIRIQITLKSEIAEKLKDVLTGKELENLEYSLRYSPKTTDIDITDYSLADLRKVKDVLAENKLRTSLITVSNYIEIREGNKEETPIKNINIFSQILQEVVRDLPHRIVFMKNGSIDEYLPYLITSVTFSKGYIRNGESYPDVCTINLSYNGINGFSTKKVDLFNEDCGKYKAYRNYKSILASKDMILETEDLINDYASVEKKYIEEKKKYNKQYIGNGYFATSRWDRDSVSTFVNHKFVNDEEINKNTYRGNQECRNTNDVSVYHVPYHPYLYVYDLSTYEDVFVHVNFLSDYVYDDSLREKLILPEFHKDLIDILTNDLSVLSGDIIEGKSTGTTILCKGVPGTGKTLTAEVYSEIIHKPLFKVNAGVLGLNFKDVEENLEKILKRSERWGSVLLIDEADTYIRRRGDDNAQNAVVAAFLRTLEYFNGLLFLTTNRVDDVDDAIESRCIARIVYETPDKNDAKNIWKVLSKEFEIDLHENTIEKLTDIFPGISGRDIKELLRLTARYCNGKGYDVNDVKHFISCAQFRDLVPKESNV